MSQIINAPASTDIPRVILFLCVCMCVKAAESLGVMEFNSIE